MPKPLDRRIRNREFDARRRQAKPWRALYKTPQWQALRAAQLTKQPLCERCQREGTITPATVVHHKVKHEGDAALFFGGELSSSCAPCHDRIEQIIEVRGYEPGVTADGRPRDANHPWNRG